jgi:hypothetical protein
VNFDKDQKAGTGKYGDKGSTEDEFYNVSGTHEGKHLEAGQIKKYEEYNDGGRDPNSSEEEYKYYMKGPEGAPHKAEVDARKEYRQKYGGGDAWKVQEEIIYQWTKIKSKLLQIILCGADTEGSIQLPHS